MMLGYRIKIEPDDNGTLLVTCPALPEVTTFGDDEADAMRRGRRHRRGHRGAHGGRQGYPEGHQRGPALCVCLRRADR